jgi:hypothetical protein
VRPTEEYRSAIVLVAYAPTAVAEDTYFRLNGVVETGSGKPSFLDPPFRSITGRGPLFSGKGMAGT